MQYLILHRIEYDFLFYTIRIIGIRILFWKQETARERIFMWDLVPWAARWAEGQSKKSQKYWADDAHKNMWVPLLHVGSKEKAVFSWERMVPCTHAQAARTSLLLLPCMRLLSPPIILTIPAPSSLHLLVLLPSTPSHGQGQFKQRKEDDQTDG